MSKGKIQDYSDVKKSFNIKHVVDARGEGHFCHCGKSPSGEKQQPACCAPEGEFEFDRSW